MYYKKLVPFIKMGNLCTVKADLVIDLRVGKDKVYENVYVDCQVNLK